MPEARAALSLAPLLRGAPRRGRVLGVFPRAAYIGVGGTVLALVARDGLALPIALLLDEPSPFGGLTPGVPAVVGGGSVRAGGLRVAVDGWWDPRPQVGRLIPARLAELEARLAGRPSAVAGHLSTDGDLAAMAERLIGLGPGLTPAGDDVLAGALAARRVFGGDGFALPAGRRTTALSLALLACAARGEVLAEAGALLLALGGDGCVAPAAEALVRVGHTSGRDLAAGIVLGCRSVGEAP